MKSMKGRDGDKMSTGGDPAAPPKTGGEYNYRPSGDVQGDDRPMGASHQASHGSGDMKRSLGGASRAGLRRGHRGGGKMTGADTDSDRGNCPGGDRGRGREFA